MFMSRMSQPVVGQPAVQVAFRDSGKHLRSLESMAVSRAEYRSEYRIFDRPACFCIFHVRNSMTTRNTLCHTETLTIFDIY